MAKEVYAKICDDYINDIYKAAKEYFCNGIYIKCDSHPCGWDFISFEWMECSADMFEQPLDSVDISNGIYDIHQYDGFTLEEIIKEVGMTGWCFEISGVDNLE